MGTNELQQVLIIAPKSAMEVNTLGHSFLIVLLGDRDLRDGA